LSRDQLLDELAWRDRVEFRHRGAFRINRLRVVPNTAAEALLDSAIDAVTGGYVALVGSPGSGKSTLLTTLPERSRGPVSDTSRSSPTTSPRRAASPSTSSTT
jgi:ABC-type nitrate/sulfonate/bicarbonate transport system ATPase subunit